MNLPANLLGDVYNFREPMFRYRFLLYFRQVRGIPQSIGQDAQAGLLDVELYFELFNTCVTIPLILLKDTSCEGFAESPYSIVPPEGSFVGKALVLKPFQVLTKSSQGLAYW